MRRFAVLAIPLSRFFIVATFFELLTADSDFTFYCHGNEIDRGLIIGLFLEGNASARSE